MAFDTMDAVNGLIGGLLIGLSSALFLLMLGRIAGISGLAASLLPMGNGASAKDHRLEAGLFIAGLVVAPLGYGLLVGPVDIIVTQNPLLLIAAGLLVGLGTRLGSGCTSGHGVCGLSRLSPRSIVATGLFMAVAVLVASVLRPVLGG